MLGKTQLRQCCGGLFDSVWHLPRPKRRQLRRPRTDQGHPQYLSHRQCGPFHRGYLVPRFRLIRILILTQMDHNLAIVRLSTTVNVLTFISTIICIALRCVLFLCSVNLLFNLDEIETMRDTILFRKVNDILQQVPGGDRFQNDYDV